MELEHTTRTFPIDENLQEKVDALVKEGWELVPGVLPVAVYHLVRIKKDASAPSGQAFGKLTVDDSKIMVIPAGQKAN